MAQTCSSLFHSCRKAPSFNRKRPWQERGNLDQNMKRIFFLKELQAPVVRRLDNAIQRINNYPVYKWNKPRYLLDSDLSSGQCYPVFEQPRPDLWVQGCACMHGMEGNYNWYVEFNFTNTPNSVIKYLLLTSLQTKREKSPKSCACFSSPCLCVNWQNACFVCVC